MDKSSDLTGNGTRDLPTGSMCLNQLRYIFADVFTYRGVGNLFICSAHCIAVTCLLLC
jgi:hypothetical protein